MERKIVLVLIAILSLAIIFVGCEGPMGPAGDPGTDGIDGDDGQDGEDYVNPELVVSKVVASDGTAGDRLGYSVSISGDGNIAVVGAYLDDDGAVVDSGSAYVFRHNGNAWVEEQKLVASNGASGDWFGRSVAISSDGTTLVIGVEADDDNGYNSGSAYIFRYNGSAWVEEQKLVASDGASNDGFGKSVALSEDGTTAILGAYNDDSNSGSAYIFRYNGSGWVEEQKLVASDAASGDWFGYSVSISVDGDAAIVGARYSDSSGSNSGSAYIFRYNGSSWVQESKLIAQDGDPDDYFGCSVAMSEEGDSVIVGADGDDSNSGSAYLFRQDGSAWSQMYKLTAPDGASGDRFGGSVALSGDGKTAFLGAYYDDDNGSNSGSAYVFSKEYGLQWSFDSKMIAPGGSIGDWFGWSVSLSEDGNTAILGAFGTDGSGSNSGSAYIYEF